MVITVIRSLAAYVITALYVLVAGPVGLLAAVAFRSNAVLFVLGHAGVRLALGLAGINYSVSNRERIPQDRAVIFCANHQSNLDPPVLFEVLHPRLYFLYKAELDRLPVLGKVFSIGGFVAVERGTNQARIAADIVASRVRSGRSFLIFPEGTRSRTTSLLPFRNGSFAIAIKARAPVVPVAITGGQQAMKKGSWLVRPARVTVRIGEPIETVGLVLEQRTELSGKVRAAIEQLIAVDTA